MIRRGYDFQHSAGLSLEDARDDATRLFLDLWKRKSGDRFAPSRDEFDWLEMPMAVVPRIMIVDVLTSPLDFQYRYFGTWHVECHGRDMTGVRVSEYEEEDYRDFVHAGYAKIIEARRPTLSVVSMILNDLPYQCEILRLPLSSDGRTVDMIMVVESLLG